MVDLVKGFGGEAGFGENKIPYSEYVSQYVDLSAIFPKGLNFFGKTYTGILIADGGVSLANGPSAPRSGAFIAPLSLYYESPLEGPQTPTPGGTSTGSNAIYWDIDPVKKSINITWDDINGENAFQLRLVDKSALGKPGDFDIVFRYEATNLVDFYQSGGDYIDYAYAGFSNADDTHKIDLAGSGVAGAGDTTLLQNLPNLSNIGRPGIFVYEVRNENLATISAKVDAIFDYQTIVDYGEDGPETYNVKGVREGNSGSIEVTFTLTRTGDLDSALTVDYDLRNYYKNRERLVSADDFVGRPPSGTVHFAAGQSQIVVKFNIAGDQKYDADLEWFELYFTADKIGASAQAGVFVLDDDPNNQIGTVGNDQLYGSGFDDVLSGQAGNDILSGELGNDTLEGGTGNDVFFGGAGTDTVTYASSIGPIIMSLAKGTYQRTGGAGADRLWLDFNEQFGRYISDIENLTGSSFGDKLTGDAQINVITGLGGNDRLNGLEGADTLIGGTGNDFYYVDDTGDTEVELAGQGTDLVIATANTVLGDNVENLSLKGKAAINGTGNVLVNKIDGNDAANVITGLGGADRMTGNGGNDTLIGGAGADILRGGAGADTFVFDTLETANPRDTILDFVHRTDKLALQDAVFTALSSTGGVLDAGEFGIGARAATADMHLIYNAAKGALYYDADGKGGAAQILIGLFVGRPVLDAGDFVIT